MKVSGSEIIVQCLLEQGIDTVFGYPGGSVLNIYDALYKHSDEIRHIMTAHEQGAAHAADGYARSTGKTGVVFATSGPGATNLITGIATAYMDSSPVVAITGNVATDLLGRDSFQEVNIKEISKPVTKASFQVMEMKDLAPTLRKAFTIANTGRKGPVLVDVPKDISALEWEYEKLNPEIKEEKAEIDEQLIKEAVRLIESSKRPIIYAGGGIIGANASKELTALADIADIPVCCSVMGMGGVSGKHKLFAGGIGMHGAYETAMATENADLILALGARFSDRVAGNREKFGEKAKIIHVDIDEKEIGKNVAADFSVVGNLKDVLSHIVKQLKPQNHSQWKEQINTWREYAKKTWQNKVLDTNKDGAQYPSGQDALRKINKMKKPDDIIVTDVGQHQMWTAQCCEFEKPNTFLTSGGLGTMGFGVGAAIGAKIGNPESRVTLITGDGSFHMNANELVTLRSYNIPVVIVVMNNSVLGMVRQWQKMFYENRFSQTDPHRQTSFENLAKAYGIKGMTVTDKDSVDSALEEAYSLNEPVLVDLRISPDENVLPMIPPGKTPKDIIMEM